jgi:ATP-dependent Clp protease adaptor protein ClpS
MQRLFDRWWLGSGVDHSEITFVPMFEVSAKDSANGPTKGSTMTKTIVAPRTKTKTQTKTQRPPLYKVILLNDDYTPREFVVLVLKAVFRMSGDQAYHVMMTAHRRGACVIAVFTRDVAETKAKEGTELGKSKGYPLFFTTEPEQ